MAAGKNYVLRWLAVLFLAAGAGLLAYAWRQPTVYYATATVQLLRDVMLAPENQPRDGGYLLIDDEFFRTQLLIAEGQVLQEAVTQRLSGRPNPENVERNALLRASVARLGGLANCFTAQPIRSPGFLQFRARATSPDDAARLCNYFTDEFINYTVKWNIETSMRAVEDMRNHVDAARDKARGTRAQLAPLQERVEAAPDSLTPKEQAAYAGLQEQLIAEEQRYDELMQRFKSGMFAHHYHGPNARIIDKALPPLHGHRLGLPYAIGGGLSLLMGAGCGIFGWMRRAK